MFETILADAAREPGVPLPEPCFEANVLKFLPTMLSLRRWSLKGRMKRR